jgi:Na+/serine symporter
MADLQTLDLILFAVGTFAAALVTGVAGFAFGIVAAAVWLYSLPPAQTRR